MWYYIQHTVKDVILRFRGIWYDLKRLLILLKLTSPTSNLSIFNLQFHPQNAVCDCHRRPPLNDLPMTVPIRAPSETLYWPPIMTH